MEHFHHTCYHIERTLLLIWSLKCIKIVLIRRITTQTTRTRWWIRLRALTIISFILRNIRKIYYLVVLLITPKTSIGTRNTLALLLHPHLAQVGNKKPVPFTPWGYVLCTLYFLNLEETLNLRLTQKHLSKHRTTVSIKPWMWQLPSLVLSLLASIDFFLSFS